MHYLRKSLIFFIPLLFIEFSSGRDTLSTGQTLEGDQVLVSSSKTFVLGFFSPQMSRNRYIGIWYYNVSEKIIVWVANRDNPVNGTSGLLSFQNFNNLVIYGPDLKIPIWSMSFLGPGKNYSAQLRDTGNFVVFEEDKGVIAWQSFDHPTDTWLPGMKLGLNRKTRVSWSLRSWKSGDDPGVGKYSFRMEDNNRELSELSLYKGPDRIWRTGPLNGGGQFIVDMSVELTLNFTYVGNKDEVSVMYSVQESEMDSIIVVRHYGTAVRMFRFTSSPDLWDVNWQAPGVFCDKYGACGPNGHCYAGSAEAPVAYCDCLPGSEAKSQRDWKKGIMPGGCVRKRDHKDCRNGEGFSKLPGREMPDTATTRVDSIQGLKECQELCLRDCNCTAYANVLKMGNACVMWYGDLLDTKQFGKGGLDLFVRVDLNGTRKRKQQQHYSFSKKKLKVAAVLTSVGVAGFIVVSILCWHRYKRKGALRSRAEQRQGNLLNDYSTQLFVERQTGGDLPFFDLISLAEATNNFSHENKLGEGGFGSVYKGTLKNGQEIAVKRLSETSKQGLEEFKNEATLIAKHMHRNLVSLLGCCAQQNEKLLIYEFMPNKSLDSLIFDKTKSSCLDWKQRFNIILGITRGMVYLHQDCKLKIIHRDLKASNVLLDAQMNPKISDFGIARFFEGDQVEGTTNRVIGTYGYMSPEYAADGTFSIKSDVFSFGVLLLEIITGMKNKSYDKSVNLISKVWDLWKEERALEIVDPSLGGDYSAKTFLRCIHVGLLSLQAHAIHRPTMSDIAAMLSYETDLPTPREPGFYFNKSSYDQDTSSSSVGTHSANEFTLSVIEPR